MIMPHDIKGKSSNFSQRKTRRGAAIPIDDEDRLDILENFIEIFENNELDSVLISSLQSILEVEGCSEII